MQSGRLREAFGDALADRSLLGLYGLCFLPSSSPSLTDRTASLLTGNSPTPIDRALCGELEKISRRMGKESTGEKQNKKKETKIIHREKRC